MAGCILVLQNVPQAGGNGGEVCVNRAVLFQSVDRKLLVVVLFSGHLVLLVEVCVFI